MTDGSLPVHGSLWDKAECHHYWDIIIAISWVQFDVTLKAIFRTLLRAMQWWKEQRNGSFSRPAAFSFYWQVFFTLLKNKYFACYKSNWQGNENLWDFEGSPTCIIKCLSFILSKELFNDQNNFEKYFWQLTNSILYISVVG